MLDKLSIIIIIFILLKTTHQQVGLVLKVEQEQQAWKVVKVVQDLQARVEIEEIKVYPVRRDLLVEQEQQVSAVWKQQKTIKKEEKLQNTK